MDLPTVDAAIDFALPPEGYPMPELAEVEHVNKEDKPDRSSIISAVTGINTDTVRQTIGAVALAIELNEPVADAITGIDITDGEWQTLSNQPAFSDEVDAHRETLKAGNNLTSAAFSRLLPATIQRLGNIISDDDMSPNAHISASEIILRESGKSIKTQKAKSGAGEKFVLNITFGDDRQQVVIDGVVEGGGTTTDLDLGPVVRARGDDRGSNQDDAFFEIPNESEI